VKTGITMAADGPNDSVLDAGRMPYHRWARRTISRRLVSKDDHVLIGQNGEKYHLKLNLDPDTASSRCQGAAISVLR
jgi:hypothetical protein